MSPQTPYLLLRCRRPNTSSMPAKIHGLASPGISKSSKISNHLRSFYSPGTVAPGKTQLGADFGLHHLGNCIAWAHSGQLQTRWEHHHPAPAQLILHRGWRLVVSGYIQSLHPTGLGKSLPLNCQHQSKLNYKGRVYSAHTKGSPQLPS